MTKLNDSDREGSLLVKRENCRIDINQAFNIIFFTPTLPPAYEGERLDLTGETRAINLKRRTYKFFLTRLSFSDHHSSYNTRSDFLTISLFSALRSAVNGVY